MNINPIVLSIPIFFLLIGIEVLIQQFSKRKLYRFNDALTNISCGVTQQVSGVFLKLFGIGLYVLVYEYLRIWDIPSNWYTLIILFIATDFAYYWAHRMSHEINLFWSGHVVHHQSEDYNLSVALRQSSFQVIWTSAFYFPLAIIGFEPLDFALMAALTTLYQFWIHTELIGKLGFLEHFMVTPSHHRVHHGRNPKYIDRNHGGTFIIWDMMFGTFQKEEETPTYGITTPVNSWNPVWANFSHYKIMLHEMKQIDGLLDKIKYVFYKPGWLPKDMGGYRSAPELDQANYHKYETHSATSLNLYVLVQYAVLLGIATWFLFFQKDMAMGLKIGVALLIAIASVTIGALFENKPWVKWAEIARIIAYALLPAYLTYWQSSPQYLIQIGVGYAILSLIWLFRALSTTSNQVSATNE
jgi:sterol desaturase/sphingolipid hydroxylase (fatty acid hydroxylase superfamily)